MWKFLNEIIERKTKVWGRYLLKQEKILKKEKKVFLGTYLWEDFVLNDLIVMASTAEGSTLFS